MQQKANEAIVMLIQSADFKNCIGKVHPEHLQADLAAEVYLILLETNPNKIVDMHDNKQLHYYAARIIMNLAFSSTSPFYKKYRTVMKAYVDTSSYHKDEFYDELVEHQSELLEKIIDNIDNTDLAKQRHKEELLAISFIDKLYWYDAAIVKLYLQLGDYRKVASETRIPTSSIYYTVQNAAKELKRLVSGCELPNDEEVNVLLEKIQIMFEKEKCVA